MSREIRRIVYHGRVQGVGFRATTNRLATSFDVSGYVKNLADGSVEIVASGESAELDRLQAAIAREFGAKIRGTEISPMTSISGEPSGFSIRY